MGSTVPGPRTEVVHVIATLAQGGAEVLLADLAAEQSALGRSVSVIAARGGAVADRLKGTGVEVILLVDGPRQVHRAWRLVRDPGVALCTWMYHATLAVALVGRTGRRVMSLHHDDPRDPGLFWLTAVTARACALLSPRFAAAVFVSEDAAGRHRDIGFRCATRVIPPGRSPQRFRPPSQAERRKARGDLGLGRDEVVVMHPARNHPDKDPRTLLDAFAQLSAVASQPISLVLAGRDQDADHVVLPPSVTGRVVLAGELPDVRDALWAADVVCLSSATEASPLALVEAMMCGLVPVVTDVGACRAIVGDTGFIAPPRTAGKLAEALARAVQAVTADDGTARRRAREQVAGRTVDAMVQAYSDLLLPTPTSRAHP